MSYRILIKPEGERKFKKTNIAFKHKKDASTFAGIEEIAGQGEQYTYRKEKSKPWRH